MGTVPIRFELEADIDDQKFSMEGDGEGNRDEGHCAMEVKIGSGYPEGFNPVSCPLICSQQTSLAFAKSTDPSSDIVGLANGEYQVSPHRTGRIHKTDGKKLAHLEVAGEVTQEDGKVVSRQKMTGFSNLPPLKHAITPVRDFILPSGPGEATSLTRYQLECQDGERLEGLTVVPYRWDSKRQEGLSAPIMRQVDVDAQWDGKETLDAEYNISMSTLDAGNRTSVAPTAVPSSSDD